MSKNEGGGGKKIKFCIYTHDLIRIYTNVVVSNKQ